jgi:hypothetical protein
MESTSNAMPDAGERHDHAWDEHGQCWNCAAVDFDQVTRWRPPWRTPDTGELLPEAPDWAR